MKTGDGVVTEVAACGATEVSPAPHATAPSCPAGRPTRGGACPRNRATLNRPGLPPGGASAASRNLRSFPASFGRPYHRAAALRLRDRGLRGHDRQRHRVSPSLLEEAAIDNILVDRARRRCDLGNNACRRLVETAAKEAQTTARRLGPGYRRQAVDHLAPAASTPISTRLATPDMHHLDDLLQERIVRHHRDADLITSRRAPGGTEDLDLPASSASRRRLNARGARRSSRPREGPLELATAPAQSWLDSEPLDIDPQGALPARTPRSPTTPNGFVLSLERHPATAPRARRAIAIDDTADRHAAFEILLSSASRLRPGHHAGDPESGRPQGAQHRHPDRRPASKPTDGLLQGERLLRLDMPDLSCTCTRSAPCWALSTWVRTPGRRSLKRRRRRRPGRPPPAGRGQAGAVEERLRPSPVRRAWPPRPTPTCGAASTARRRRPAHWYAACSSCALDEPNAPAPASASQAKSYSGVALPKCAFRQQPWHPPSSRPGESELPPTNPTRRIACARNTPTHRRRRCHQEAETQQAQSSWHHPARQPRFSLRARGGGTSART